MAPEIFQKVGYSYKCDIFSLGSVFYNLLSRRYLFNGNQQEKLAKNTECDIRHVPMYIASFSPLCQDLVMNMIAKDPLIRPEASKALKHEWFTLDRDILDGLL